MTWHVPNAEEIDFALQLFRELVEPAMTRLDLLLETGRSMQHFSYLILKRNIKHPGTPSGGMTFVGAFTGTHSLSII